MKNLSALIVCIFFSYAAIAQSREIKRIESILKKNLVGKGFLRGMYDLPCSEIGALQIAANNDIVLTGEQKGCNVTFSVKDARITVEQYKVQVYRISPNINISFYTENTALVLKTLIELKNIPAIAEVQDPVKKESRETVIVPPVNNSYTGLFNTYPLAMMESKVMEPGLYEASLKETETNSAVTKTAKKVGNVSGTAILYANNGIQVAELFFDARGKFYYYNRNIDMEYLEGAGKALTEKGFVVKSITQTSGAIENTWRKPGHPYVFVLQYFPGKKKLGIVILDKDIYN